MFEHDYKNYPELTNTEINEFGFSSPHKQITQDFEAFVTQVHDGDTITVSTTFRDFKFPIRFTLIDAPELNNGGDAARDWLKTRILNQTVKVIIDPNNRVGKYGRLLGNIFFNGLSINNQELMLGLAKEYGKKFEGQIPPIYKDLRLENWF